MNIGTEMSEQIKYLDGQSNHVSSQLGTKMSGIHINPDFGHLVFPRSHLYFLKIRTGDH